MVTTLHTVAALLYAAAGLVFAGALAGGRRATTWAGPLLVLFAVAVHAGALAGYTSLFGELPLVGLGPSLSTLAFLIGLMGLGATVREETRPLGLVLMPITVVLLVAALVMSITPTGGVLAFRGAWFRMHVVLAFLGYTGLAVAFAAGLLYLLQHRALKGKHFGRMFRFFPSLETLDRLGRWGLLLGFPTLTLGLVIGWGWARRFDQQYGLDNPKVLWGVMTWLVFVAALTARVGGARRDRRGAMIAVVGFVVVVVAYVVLRLMMPDGHLFL